MPNTNGFEIDWMVKSRSVSPTSYTWPSAVTTQMPNQFGSARPELGDVGGHLALVELPVLVEEAMEVVEDRGSGHGAEVEVVEGAIEPAVEACHGCI